MSVIGMFLGFEVFIGGVVGIGIWVFESNFFFVV